MTRRAHPDSPEKTIGLSADKGVASQQLTAVIGVPAEKWGEVVVAYVQPRPVLTVDPAALEALAARSLSGYKWPTSYAVVEAIPKNAVGKIDKVAVRATHAAASAAAYRQESGDRHGPGCRSTGCVCRWPSSAGSRSG
ncbi:hypothetical protein JIX56_40790 [Streptomyces sp. CA-210063]|uniref:AMP-binding enzyme n=1 Tax=Streptomyces sp. CA-210063 TaxID=2801029 RepID=UPI00214C3042|nr:hypothetical protein [Streptomyces sp. CA-210063]UUU35683.1 hypothetical protein JIX56_40790 [Streptomyces sp. CA-210063]